MDRIRNTATVSEYSYLTNPEKVERLVKGPISSTATCEMVNPEVSIDKVCSPAIIDKGNTFSINYVLTHVDKGANGPKFTNVTITDPIFTLLNYAMVTSTTNILSINTTTGVAVVDLTSVSGKLDPGESVTAEVVFTTTNNIPPTTDYFVTTATGTFQVSQGLTKTDTDTCGTLIRNGDLEIEKIVTSECPTFSGDTITYQITITNTGNVSSTIPVEGLTDYPPLGDLTNITLLAPIPAGIVFDGTKIYNNAILTVPANSSVVIHFRATVV